MLCMLAASCTANLLVSNMDNKRGLLYREQKFHMHQLSGDIQKWKRYCPNADFLRCLSPFQKEHQFTEYLPCPCEIAAVSSLCLQDILCTSCVTPSGCWYGDRHVFNGSFCAVSFSFLFQQSKRWVQKQGLGAWRWAVALTPWTKPSLAGGHTTRVLLPSYSIQAPTDFLAHWK